MRAGGAGGLRRAGAVVALAAVACGTGGLAASAAPGEVTSGSTRTATATGTRTATGTATATGMRTATRTVAGAGSVAARRAAAAETFAEGTTVVSLTFDDGFASQWRAKRLLRRHGMHATFYVNSERIGTDRRLTLEQLRALRADGHEIAGHTSNHTRLIELAPEEQVQEICDDRVTLNRLGFDVTNFAYPYAAWDATARNAVATCGYTSGRTIGDIGRRSATCKQCSYAESIPPKDAYVVRTGPSVVPATSLSWIKKEIMTAERRGGGWVPLVFHEVCDGCSAIAVSPAVLANLLDWLDRRESRGVVVRSVQEVIGGEAKPVVPAPVQVPKDGELVNPSLETASGGSEPPVIDPGRCWQHAGYGKNTVTWLRSKDAHHGGWAQTLTMTSHTDGDRKLIVRQTDWCAPRVTPGRSYTLGAWYKSTAQTRMLVYYRVPGKGWVYWTASAPTGPVAAWTRHVFRTPPIPSGATRISFGLQLATTGTLTTDDYTLSGNSSSLLYRSGSVGGLNPLLVTALPAIVIGLGVLVLLILVRRRRPSTPAPAE
ncbi:MAG: polysaccharide deacetylase family protein [Actinomycetales bacterium]|nr:polysaccharide deacetylase family protein [Actinomycetales bacterium]